MKSATALLLGFVGFGTNAQVSIISVNHWLLVSAEATAPFDPFQPPPQRSDSDELLSNEVDFNGLVGAEAWDSFVSTFASATQQSAFDGRTFTGSAAVSYGGGPTMASQVYGSASVTTRMTVTLAVDETSTIRIDAETSGLGSWLTNSGRPYGGIDVYGNGSYYGGFGSFGLYEAGPSGSLTLTLEPGVYTVNADTLNAAFIFDPGGPSGVAGSFEPYAFSIVIPSPATLSVAGVSLLAARRRR